MVLHIFMLSAASLICAEYKNRLFFVLIGNYSTLLCKERQRANASLTSTQLLLFSFARLYTTMHTFNLSHSLTNLYKQSKFYKQFKCISIEVDILST